jgi:hypothetical protein
VQNQHDVNIAEVFVEFRSEVEYAPRPLFTEYLVGAFFEGRQESFNERPCGDASLFAVLLDWVRPLR